MYEFSKFLVDTKKSFDFVVSKEQDCFKWKVKYKHWKKIIHIKFCFWKYTQDDLEKFDAIIKAPWVSPYQERFSKVQDKFTSQTQIFYNNYSWKVIWITWTKGKSTISSFTYNALKNAKFKVKLVGNIWKPVLDEISLEAEKTYDYVVYEISSYMLDAFHPKNYISVLNNVYTCHLDWHKNLENYTEAKQNILKKSRYKLLNNVFSHLAWDTKVSIFWSSGDYYYKDHHFYIWKTKIASAKESRLLWIHNMENISAVVWILHKIIKRKKSVGKIIERTLKNFVPLEHRLEKVGTFKGVTFVNDAIAVTPEATIAAIKTFSPDLETLFLWWKEAGYNFSQLESVIAHETSIKNIVLFPDADILPQIFHWILMEKQKEVIFWGRTVRVLKTKKMESAVKFAYEYTQPKKVALLSCAAQSFSLWKNFEIKGAEFKKYIKDFSK